METALFIVQLVTAVVLAATLVAVIIYTVKTSDLAKYAQEQAIITARQAVERQRPLLMPDGAPTFQGQPRAYWLKWDENQQALKFRNIGPGPALNVASVLYGCESYMVGDLGAQQRDSSAQDIHWTLWLGQPIGPGEEVQADHALGASTFHEGLKHIGSHSLNAPPEPGVGEAIDNRVAPHTARITATYLDVFGHKHASVFDYVPHRRGWELIEFIPDIVETLQELDGKP